MTGAAEARGRIVTAPDLVSFIRGLRLPLGDEKQMQSELAQALDDLTIESQREYRLSARDVVDFFLPGGIAIECKLRGRRMAIYRQLRRYALHEEVSQIVLVTNTSMGLPPEIEGKPTYYASLGMAWL